MLLYGRILSIRPILPPFLIIQASLILNEHLIKACDIPRPRLRIQRNIRLLHVPSLQSAGLDRTIRNTAVETVGASLDSEVRKADLEGVASGNSRRACSQKESADGQQPHHTRGKNLP